MKQIAVLLTVCHLFLQMSYPSPGGFVLDNHFQPSTISSEVSLSDSTISLLFSGIFLTEGRVSVTPLLEQVLSVLYVK